MKIDKYVDKHINSVLRAADIKKESDYVGSGRLSASQLGWPLQWQILKSKGIKPPPPDDYTLRKFLRGNHVEEWFITILPNVTETQGKVLYRGVSGRFDAMVDTTEWDFNVGVIPLEVKSVTNEKYRRIAQRKGSDRGHLLQGGLYALSKSTEHFALAYIASDDYRVRIHIHNVKEVKSDIDGIIDRFDAQMALGTVPVFEPEEVWQKNIKYNTYPEFSGLTEDEIKIKLKEYGI